MHGLKSTTAESAHSQWIKRILYIGALAAILVLLPAFTSSPSLSPFVCITGNGAAYAQEAQIEEGTAEPENGEESAEEPEVVEEEEVEAVPELPPEEEEVKAAPEPPPLEELAHPVAYTPRRGVPSAFTLPKGMLSLGFLYRDFDEDSIESQGGITSTGFRIDYGISDNVEISLRLWQNDTNNGRAVISPFWNDTITADMWETDIKLLLSGDPRPPSGPIAEEKPPNAFSIGISHQDSTLSREGVDDDLRILTGYATYSTYLSPRLATHTYFSTGRFTGDLLSGTMNTLAVGMDYDLLDVRGKLKLTLDGSLDIYNFRRSSFSATRVSHVNVGLVYAVTNNVEISAGYGLHSDSDSDQSSTEFNVGLSYVFDTFDLFGRSRGEGDKVEEVVDEADEVDEDGAGEVENNESADPEPEDEEESGNIGETEGQEEK